MSTVPHWATGPKEILEHGFELIALDTDSNRRLAMISIDNAIELAMQTYISLPKRLTGIEISRRERDEFCSNFPSLLDGMETHASERLVGMNLGEIEWFHRLRNELYHQGNGLTVEKSKLEAYSQLARELFIALFEVNIEPPKSETSVRLGEFLDLWIQMERYVVGKNQLRLSQIGKIIPDILASRDDFNPRELSDFTELRTIRNKVVHGMSDPKETITDEVISRMEKLLDRLKDTPF